jgi:hypothetical protein
LNVALSAVRGADFYVPFYPARDFHGLAALEFGGDIKTVERIVDPDAILSRVALHGGAIAGKCRSGGSCAHEEEEDSQSVSHVVSRSGASGVCGASESGVANGACPEPRVRFPSLFRSRDSVCRTYRIGTTVRLGRKRAGESSALRVLKYLVLKFEPGSILLRLGGSQCITTFL